MLIDFTLFFGFFALLGLSFALFFFGVAEETNSTRQKQCILASIVLLGLAIGSVQLAMTRGSNENSCKCGK